MSEASSSTRDRLLEAARDLFTTQGYHATTTPVLAKHAGVAEGTIYRHFPSKQALLNAAFQDVQTWGTKGIREVSEGPGDSGSQLGRLGLRWLAAAENDPARMRLLLAWQLTGDMDETSVAAVREFRAGIERLVAVGKQQGTVRAGVVELWTTVWLTLVTSAVGRVASGEWGAGHPHALATLEAAWEAIAWRPIATPPADESTPASSSGSSVEDPAG
jgi:AcrR family transcriptional regulator